MRIIDTHTHVFPDLIAPKALHALTNGAPGVSAYLDGTVSGLLESMENAGIDTSVAASILTKPSQFNNVLNWSKSIRSKRIIPFMSVHPSSAKVLDEIHIIAEEGFLGIKMHPYYQKFVLDDEVLFPIYETVARYGLVLLMHTGFDLGFERVRICDPIRTANVITRFPELKFIASHLGAWSDWDEVEKHLVGKNVYFDISYALAPDLAPRAREIITAHTQGRVLFGSDSPWVDQSDTLKALKSLNLENKLEEDIMGKNAEKLLGL